MSGGDSGRVLTPLLQATTHDTRLLVVVVLMEQSLHSRMCLCMCAECTGGDDVESVGVVFSYCVASATRVVVGHVLLGLELKQ